MTTAEIYVALIGLVQGPARNHPDMQAALIELRKRCAAETGYSEQDTQDDACHTAFVKYRDF